MGPIFWTGSNLMLKSMVIFEGFSLNNSALFGLVSYNDPLWSETRKSDQNDQNDPKNDPKNSQCFGIYKLGLPPTH